MADPHPIATYVAGCVFLALAAAVSCKILIDDVRRQRGRIWREFIGNFRRVAPQAELHSWSGQGPIARDGRHLNVSGGGITVHWGGAVLLIAAARVERA